MWDGSHWQIGSVVRVNLRRIFLWVRLASFARTQCCLMIRKLSSTAYLAAWILTTVCRSKLSSLVNTDTRLRPIIASTRRSMIGLVSRPTVVCDQWRTRPSRCTILRLVDSPASKCEVAINQLATGGLAKVRASITSLAAGGKQSSMCSSNRSDSA
jgi:hypothetical protein